MQAASSYGVAALVEKFGIEGIGTVEAIGTIVDVREWRGRAPVYRPPLLGKDPFVLTSISEFCSKSIVVTEGQHPDILCVSFRQSC